jgi:cysteine desulfurase family protein (TIGR01976 family)
MTTTTLPGAFDVAAVREHFPALRRELDGRPLVYLDGPGGTQVSGECIDAMAGYLVSSNANTYGAFVTSAETDSLVAEAHAAAADFLGAHEPEEIVFGANMTTLTFAVSRAIGRDLQPGDEVVVTRLDHDGNVAPWLALAEDRGLEVRWVDIDVDDCTLQLDELERVMSDRTRVVAIGLASNAVGTINDVGLVIEMAHAHGAIAYVDAVHAAPHLPIDVSNLQADLLVCSPYKFFAPHLGMLYGRRELLERLRAYRVRPAGEALPGKYETGTQSHEALAGLLGTFGYLETLGRTHGGATAEDDRRTALHAAMSAIREYERGLIGPLLEGLHTVPGLTIHGIDDPRRVDERVPTVALSMEGHHPRRVAEHLAAYGINTWDGDYYAVEVVRRLGLEAAGGMLRVGLVHYNTLTEIDRLLDALQQVG